MPNISKLEKEKRVLTVQTWILDGVQEDFMRKQMRTEWGISTRQSKRYIASAHAAWKQDSDIDMETRRQSKIAELQQLRRSLKAEFKGTPAGIRAIMLVEKQIIRLEPYSIKKIQLSNDPDNPLEMNQVVVFNLPDNKRD